MQRKRREKKKKQKQACLDASGDSQAAEGSGGEAAVTL